MKTWLKVFLFWFNTMGGKMMLFSLAFKVLSRTPWYEWVMRNIVAKVNLQILGYTKYPVEEYFKVRESILTWNETHKHSVCVFTSGADLSLATIVVRRGLGMYWGHAGFIYIDKDDPTKDRIVHMQSKGITDEHPLRLLKRIDSLRVNAIPLTERNFGRVTFRIDRAVEKKMKYDFTAELGNGVWYCSEAIYGALKDNYDGKEFKPRDRMGRKSFEPDDVAKQGYVIYEHRSEAQNG